MLRVLPVVVAVLFAGCVNDAFLPLGGNAPTATDDPIDVAPGQLADPKTPGQLRGVVTNEALAPLKGANVTLLSLNRTVITGDDGSFHFPGLPNGRALVFAQAAGHFGRTQAATIKNGTVVTLDFRLTPLPVVTPYHESIELAGLIACDGIMIGPAGNQPMHCGGADPNDKRVLETEIAGKAKTIIVEVQWEAVVPTAQALRVRVETVGFGAQDAVLANHTGRSVLRLEIPSPGLEKYYPSGGTVRVVADPAPSVAGEEANTDVGFAFQQPFTVFFTVFYHAPAEAGFSVLK